MTPPHSTESGAALHYKPKPRSWRGFLVFGVVLAVAAFALIKFRPQGKPAAAGKAAFGQRTPSVSITTVAPKPFAIVLEGLGTVTPLATVTVKTQVDGPLQSVAYREGAAVKVGQLLAQIDPRPFKILVEQAQATQARDRAQLHNAQIDLSRYQALRGQNLIPQQQLDAQKSLVEQLLATLQMDQAAIDNAQLQLDYTHITSPVDGVAGIRLVDPGNLVHTNDATGIVVLTKLDPIAVIFTLPQDELPRLAAAMASGVQQVTAVNRNGDRVLGVGKLTVIDNQVNIATATVRLKAGFKNPDHSLWPNQFVRARIEVERREHALTLPAAAVQQGPNGSYVYVVDDKNLAHMRPVQVELIQGDTALIAAGIASGDRVVVEGQDQIKPNSAVRPRASGPKTATQAPVQGPS